jgi:hypothetical protein
LNLRTVGLRYGGRERELEIEVGEERFLDMNSSIDSFLLPKAIVGDLEKIWTLL